MVACQLQAHIVKYYLKCASYCFEFLKDVANAGVVCYHGNISTADTTNLTLTEDVRCSQNYNIRAKKKNSSLSNVQKLIFS